MLKKLPPHFKQLWLEALRSRKYKQTQGNLRDSKGFCCLGVACDLYKPKTWVEDVGWAQRTIYKTKKGSDGLPEDGDLPKTIIKVLNQEVEGVTVMSQLSEMNDEGKKFYQIARWIERNL